MSYHVDQRARRMGKSQAQRIVMEAMLDAGKRVCVVSRDGHAVIRTRVKRAGLTLDVIEPCRRLKGFVSVGEAALIPFANPQKDIPE